MDTLSPEAPTFLEYSASVVSLRGRLRPINGDAAFYRFQNRTDGQIAGFACICDGLGGVDAGAFVSTVAARSIRNHLRDTLSDSRFGPDRLSDSLSVRRQIARVLHKVNRKIYRMGCEKYGRSYQPPGTALTLAFFLDDRVTFAHIGNSRAYLFRELMLSKLTVDHSIVAELIMGGVLPNKRARQHPQRNVLTRALGIRSEVQVDFLDLELQPGDKLLLCSNGLWSSFGRDSEMAPYLQEDSSVKRIATHIVQAAYKLNGTDDLSAIVIEIDQKMSGNARKSDFIFQQDNSSNA